MFRYVVNQTQSMFLKLCILTQPFPLDADTAYMSECHTVLGGLMKISELIKTERRERQG